MCFSQAFRRVTQVAARLLHPQPPRGLKGSLPCGDGVSSCLASTRSLTSGGTSKRRGVYGFTSDGGSVVGRARCGLRRGRELCFREHLLEGISIEFPGIILGALGLLPRGHNLRPEKSDTGDHRGVSWLR